MAALLRDGFAGPDVFGLFETRLLDFRRRGTVSITLAHRPMANRASGAGVWPHDRPGHGLRVGPH